MLAAGIMWLLYDFYVLNFYLQELITVRIINSLDMVCRFAIGFRLIIKYFVEKVLSSDSMIGCFSLSQ